jgi:hypothetical protein
VASIIEKHHTQFNDYKADLTQQFGENFPFTEIIKVEVIATKEILAPSYFLFPDTTTEERQIAEAKKNYLSKIS